MSLSASSTAISPMTPPIATDTSVMSIPMSSRENVAGG